MDRPTTPPAPLEHVTVLDLSRLYPGAYCTALLADLGADVIKVEGPRSGDGLRMPPAGDDAPGHLGLNRGKRSITLDLKQPGARDVLLALAGDADVLVESARPGSLDRNGLGYEDVRTANAGLVWCSITGFGPDGPNAQESGHDLSYLGHSGVLDALTVDDAPPVPSLPVALPMAGSLAANAILAAIVGRSRTGAGTRIDISIADAATWMATEQLTSAANGDHTTWGSLACRSNYRCADDRWVTCTASEPRSWAALIEALDLPELASYRIGVDDEAAVPLVAAAFATQPMEVWLARPGAAGGVGPVRRFADVVDDPHTRHRHGIAALPDGGAAVPTSPIRLGGALNDESSFALRRPPRLGEHTDDVLRQRGFDDSSIAALRADGVI